MFFSPLIHSFKGFKFNIWDDVMSICKLENMKMNFEICVGELSFRVSNNLI